MAIISTATAVAAWSALPPDVQKAVAATAGRIIASGAANLIGRIRSRFFPSAEDRVKREAVRVAIAGVMAGYPDLQEVGLAEALGRPPFDAVILHAVNYPAKELDASVVHGAFDKSLYDLSSLSIDEEQLIQEIHSALLEALRRGSTSIARELHAGVRADQTAAAVGVLHEKVDAIASAQSLELQDKSVESQMQDAKALFDGGASSAALAIWERLEEKVLRENYSPALRTRVLQNIAIARLHDGDHVDALRRLEQARAYSPESTSVMARKVDALVVADRLGEAKDLAEEIMVRAPDSPDAWIARARTAEQPVQVSDLPIALRTDWAVLFQVGIAAAQSNRRIEAVEALREAVRHGPRSPGSLLALAGTLLNSIFPRRRGNPAPAEILDEVERLCLEVADKLTTHNHASLRARATYLLGEVSMLRGHSDDGFGFFQRAMELDTADTGIRLAAVKSRVDAGEGHVAKYLLDAIPAAERDAEWGAYRGVAALLTDSIAEIADCVQTVMSAAEDHRRVQAANVLVDALLGERDPAFSSHVEQLLPLLVGHVPVDVVHTFRARLAHLCEDHPLAMAEYESALGTLEGRVRDELALEYASSLFSANDFAAAAAQFASSTTLHEHPAALRQYASCLLKLERWTELDELLDAQLVLEPVPTWALGCDVQTALLRDDLPRAARSLDQLGRLKPEDSGVAIQHAHVLLRLRDRTAARTVIEPVLSRADLDIANTVNLALVLMHTGEYHLALAFAFRAVRAAPDDQEVQQACLFGVAMQIETSGADLAFLYERTEIQPDTVATLRNRHQETFEIVVLAEGPADVTKREFVASDPRVAALMGKTVGDTVMGFGSLAAGHAYVVVALEGAVQHTMRTALQEFERRFPNQKAMRSIYVGEGERFDASELAVVLQQREQRIERIKSRYRTQPLPLGLMSESFGLSLRRTYFALLADPTIRVEVDGPSFTSAGETAVNADTVVLTTTGIATLAELGLLALLTSKYRRLLAPRSLVEELAAELAEWEAIAARGEYSTASTHQGSIATQEASAADIARVRNSVAALHDFLIANAEILPRPPVQHPEADVLRKALGESCFDAMMLSSASAPLFTDDLFLRLVALEHRGEAGFATITMLRDAHACEQINADKLAAAVARLRAWRHSLIAVSNEEVLNELRISGYVVSAKVRLMLEDGLHPALDAVVRVEAATSLLRELALSCPSESALRAVASAIAERLTASADAPQVASAFLRSVREALRLLPLAQPVVSDAIASVFFARNLTLEQPQQPIIPA